MQNSLLITLLSLLLSSATAGCWIQEAGHGASGDGGDADGGPADCASEDSRLSEDMGEETHHADPGNHGNDGESVGCRTHQDCQDELYCNGMERCVDGLCVAGDPPQCPDDGNPCTVEMCEEGVELCTFRLVRCPEGEICNYEGLCVPFFDDCFPPEACQDGLWCTGEEFMDTWFGTCYPGHPPDCSDGDICTEDICVEDETDSPYGAGHCQWRCRDELPMCDCGEPGE
jgi:hypothetical protein